MTNTPRRRTARPDAGARVSAAVTRPVRTGLQGGVGYAVLEFIEAFGIYDFDGRQWAIAMLILTAVVSWVQVQVENYFEAGFLRAVPPKDEPVDVPDLGGDGDGDVPPPPAAPAV